MNTTTKLTHSIQLSTKYNKGREGNSVTRITPHCVVGQCSAKAVADGWIKANRDCSSNYVIGKDAELLLVVEEANRSWCSSSKDNDNKAITIECASDTKDPYTMKTIVYDKLVDLCTDICERYGKKKLIWISDKTKALAYKPAADEMQITVHRWFANKACPGDWLFNRLGGLSQTVTNRLNKTSSATMPRVLYRVQCGAFSNKANADAYLKKVQAAGFTDAFITKSE